MGPKLSAVFGAAVGLVVSGSVLTLLWFGVSGVLQVGHTDFMYLLWPSSLVLIGGWHTTARGVLITVASVVTNCLLYSVVALLLREGVVLIAKILSRR